MSCGLQKNGAYASLIMKKGSLHSLLIFFTTATITGTASAEPDSLDRADLWADTAEDIDEAPGYEEPKDARRTWSFSLGLVGGVSPDYEGSDSYGAGYGPNFSITWRDTIFYKGNMLGANLIKNKHLTAGPILSWTSGRNDDSDDKLEGLGDVDSSTEAGGFIVYRNKPSRFKLEARQDMGSGHEGALVELSGGTNLPFKKPYVFVGFGTTWASNDYMESFFGVNSKQSENSGLRRYRADAGIKDISIGLTSGHRITKRWRIGGKIGYKRLTGDAANSPIVDDKNQFIAGISFSYHTGSSDPADDPTDDF
jgi:outer membrane scaffolding protein for murein synthesis (MipA/OmpV family)